MKAYITHVIKASEVGGNNILYLMKDGISLDGIEVLDGVINDKIDYVCYREKDKARVVLHDYENEQLIFILVDDVKAQSDEKLLNIINVSINNLIQQGII